MANHVDHEFSVGVHLGTANAMIAMACESGVEVIKNRNEPITPSLVYIDKRGVEKIGRVTANSCARASTATDVQADFRREMGTAATRDFNAAGVRRTPTELSASVLRELRDSARDWTGLAPSAAVITVPVIFETPQRNATEKAGEMAGFQHSVLLPEPVAVAIAFGCRSDAEDSHWLVYDFGGGTFDASIIAVRDGQLTVVKHAGDNYLGGADFDRVLVDDFIAPHLRSEYDLPNLDRLKVASDRETLARFNLLKVLAEEIKKDLGREERVDFFREEIFEDDAGETVDLAISITRADFEAAISKFVDQSIEITKGLITDCQLTPGDIERVLLVGGSTFVPLVRRRVDSLGVEVDAREDRIFSAVQGAAIFAAGHRWPVRRRSGPISRTHARIELEYEPVGKELIPPVAGKIRLEGGATTDGLTLEISRSDGGWTSGRLPVAANGLFMADVQLREKGQSGFELKLRDAAGESIICSPGSFSITYGMSVGRATLPSGVGVVLEDGTPFILLVAGTLLPAVSETLQLQIPVAVRRGTDDAFRIEIFSGDDSDIDCCFRGSFVSLSGRDLPCDLPAGTAVEVTAEVDASGTSTIAFTIPMLDKTFEVKQSSELEHEPSEAMRDRLRRIRARLDALEDEGESAGQPAAVREVRACRVSDALREIELLIRRWELGDAVAAGMVRNRLIEASRSIKGFAARIELPVRIRAARELQARVRVQVDDMVARVDEAILTGDPLELDHRMQNLQRASAFIEETMAVGAEAPSRSPSGSGASLEAES